jgi:NAD(P)-dependent dehydrogenase (short-subunit alcohol dehydrogenase family)
MSTETPAAIIAPDVSDRPLGELFSLAGRTAVVTGSASGIGQAIARRLGEAGANVVVADLDEAAAVATAGELAQRIPGEAWAVGVDVADGASVRALSERAVELASGLDIWVNAAGIYPIQNLLEMDDAFWDRVLDINLRGTMIGAREAARQMIATGRRGVIINLASVTSFRAGSAGGAAYVASKHGVAGLTKSLAVEFGAAGIRALAIAPATVMTPGMRVLEEQFAGLLGGDFVEMMIQRVQLGRVAVADDVARVAVFCASDLAAYMTGSTLQVDGGDLSL